MFREAGLDGQGRVGGTPYNLETLHRRSRQCRLQGETARGKIIELHMHANAGGRGRREKGQVAILQDGENTD